MSIRNHKTYPTKKGNKDETYRISHRGPHRVDTTAMLQLLALTGGSQGPQYTVVLDREEDFEFQMSMRC